MSLLECLVGIALSLALVAPLLKNSAELMAKQIAYEKSQLLTMDADRAFELMGRAIRLAGYQHPKSFSHGVGKKRVTGDWILIQKKVGFNASDALMVKHELSEGVDFDCIGNVLIKDRTKNNLAMQGFSLERQASAAKGTRVNGGSLICQSLDRQGRLQQTTLMNGVNQLMIEEIAGERGGVRSQNIAGRLYRVSLVMTDGAMLSRTYERTFATRNLP